jgi:hypothetical protein
MVSPSQKRHAAQGVVAAGMCSRRQACRYLGLARSSWSYRSRPPTPRRVQTETAIVELSRKHPRYGYRRVHALVERRGLACARRTVQRVRRREGLRVTGPARPAEVPAASGRETEGRWAQRRVVHRSGVRRHAMRHDGEVPHHRR